MEKEIWVPLRYPNVKDIYEISNMGRIRSFYLNDIMKTQIHHSTGRVQISLKAKTKRKVTLFIHRMVMYNFNPVPNFEELEVNHIDGNPKNNKLSNLEWCTGPENLDHARRTGLIKLGDERHNTIYSDDIVHDICILLVKQYTRKEIIKKLNLPNTPQVKSLISNIKGRHKRTRISKYYNWEEEGSTTKRIRILNIRKTR